MIYAYKPGTAASRLARDLRACIYYPRQGKQLTAGRRAYEPVLNWGLRAHLVGSLPRRNQRLLNESIDVAVSKVAAFDKLAEANLPVPRWSKDYEDLRRRVGEERGILGRRDGLSGGVGIELLNSGPVPAGQYDFYVERISYQREFRVHVFCDEVIHVQAKMIPPEASLLVKNYESGCVYTGEQLDRFVTGAKLASLKELGKAVTAALSLDLAAVDIMLNKHNKFYVLEANTAPGLRSDAAFAAYKEALKKVWRL